MRPCVLLICGVVASGLAQAQVGLVDVRPVLGWIVLEKGVSPVLGIPGAASIGAPETEPMALAAFGGDVVLGVAADKSALILLQNGIRSEVPTAKPAEQLAVSFDGRWAAAVSAGVATVYSVGTELKKLRAVNLAGEALLTVGVGGALVLGRPGDSAVVLRDGSVARLDAATGVIARTNADGGREVLYDGTAGSVRELTVDGNRIWTVRKAGLVEIAGGTVVFHDGVLGEGSHIQTLNGNVLFASNPAGFRLIDVREKPVSYVLPRAADGEVK